MNSKLLLAKVHVTLLVSIAGFFLLGGFGNLFPPASIQADYLRWGYPDWFHFVTGSLEIVAAVLTIVPRSRQAGLALAITVMLAALATVLWNGDFWHAIAPVIALAVLGLSALLGQMRREVE